MTPGSPRNRIEGPPGPGGRGSGDRRGRGQAGGQRGGATIEHAGLLLVVALLIGGVVALVASSPADDGARGLGTSVARKIRCGAVGPGPCWRDPLTVAYGRQTAGAVRALAPQPVPRNRLLPVDFRFCRRESCALGPAGAKLTASNRRTTAFVHATGSTVTYWLFRPGQPWEAVERILDPQTVAAHAGTPLLDSDIPRLVPLESLDGRNHVRFRPIEEPPWRWQVESTHAIR